MSLRTYRWPDSGLPPMVELLDLLHELAPPIDFGDLVMKADPAGGPPLPRSAWSVRLALEMDRVRIVELGPAWGPDRGVLAWVVLAGGPDDGAPVDALRDPAGSWTKASDQLARLLDPHRRALELINGALDELSPSWSPLEAELGPPMPLPLVGWRTNWPTVLGYLATGAPRNWITNPRIAGQPARLFVDAGAAQRVIKRWKPVSAETSKCGRPRAEWIVTAESDVLVLEGRTPSLLLGEDGALKPTREIINVLAEAHLPGGYRLLKIDGDDLERVEIGDDAPTLKSFNDSVLVSLRQRHRSSSD